MSCQSSSAALMMVFAHNNHKFSYLDKQYSIGPVCTSLMVTEQASDSANEPTAFTMVKTKNVLRRSRGRGRSLSTNPRRRLILRVTVARYRSVISYIWLPIMICLCRLSGRPQVTRPEDVSGSDVFQYIYGGMTTDTEVTRSAVFTDKCLKSSRVF